MNHVTAACGHPVIAVGAPGSKARKECEEWPCDECLSEQRERRKEMDAKQVERNVQAAQIEQAIEWLKLAANKLYAIGLNETTEAASAIDDVLNTKSLGNGLIPLANRLKGTS